MTLKLTVQDRATFDRMLAKAQALASGRVSRVLAPRVAGNMVRQLASEAKATQTNPAGKAWPKTKNKQPLKWPSRATVRVELVGGKVVATVTGPDYLVPQHSGWRRMAIAQPRAGDGSRASGPGRIKRRWRGKARRILPKGSVPRRWADPILKAINAGWRSFMTTMSLAKARR